MIIDTIAEIPELAADYIQLVLENVYKGNFEACDVPGVLKNLGALATHQSVFVLSWLYKSEPKAGVIFPETIRFSFGSDDTPQLHVPVEGCEAPLRIVPGRWVAGLCVFGVSAG